MGMIVVDSLGSAGEQIADDALMLKGLARELDLPVIALCKLEEDPDYRSGRRPTIDDLPGVGRIEFVADMIVFIYREDLYEVDTYERGVAEIIVARNRNGSTGRIRLHYDAAYGRFEDPDKVVEAGDEREGPVSESDVFVSCSRTTQPTKKIIDLLHRQFREGFRLDDLLAHPSLSPGDAEQIRELVERGYRAFWLDGLYCRQKNGIWEFVDLDHQRGLFRTNPDRAVEILFDEPGDDENFDWYALVELLAIEHGSLFVFGDGAVSNGHWLVRAPKASGILEKKFSVEKHTRSTLHEVGYHPLLKIDGHEEGHLATRKDGKVEVFGREDERQLYRIEPHGLYVDRAYLDGILALFRASVGDLKGIKLLCKGPRDPVVFIVDGEPRAFLMPVKPE
ncbi:MAG: hypothetical protein D6806_13975 [Deltaproteobacteria bacterium]|nr:MAG: hypothetical protein D6806_13975 [Deltaproteobacteria bacterium]